MNAIEAKLIFQKYYKQFELDKKQFVESEIFKSEIQIIYDEIYKEANK
jgi:hypothetical protein